MISTYKVYDSCLKYIKIYCRSGIYQIFYITQMLYFNSVYLF